MKKFLSKTIIGGFIATLFITMFSSLGAFAANRIGMSPLSQKLILSPGEVYEGSFKVVSLAESTSDMDFNVTVEPFYVDENYDIYYEETGAYNGMVNWTKVDATSGTLMPNSSKDIHFTITVPEDAPAGGQYVAIKATPINNTDADSENTGATIKVTYGVAYTIYAEIAGTTIRSGEIADLEVPSFLTSGDISGASTIKNTGNVHDTAKYTLQVFPLFSNEEIYTNEESPEERIILPERTRYVKTSMPNTPEVGLFNVVYTVEFQNQTMQVKKLVIKCPIWLMVIILIVIIMLIVFITILVRKHSKKSESDD